MKKVRVEDAVGLKLCHDITKIIPGSFKGRAFARDHVITEDDVDELKNIGKEHIYVWEDVPGMIHEEEAAVRLAKAITGSHMEFEAPVEGKCIISSKVKGLLSVKSDLLKAINMVDQVTIPTLPGNYPVQKNQRIAAPRVVPLIIEEEKVKKVEELCEKKGPALEIFPYLPLKTGLVITGNEVYKGRIQDQFAPVLKKKLARFGANVFEPIYCPDDMKYIESAIKTHLNKGAELVILTGGMSVDPDDLTPGAIQKMATEFVTHGVPVQPGNMFVMAYHKDVPLIGIPGAALYYPTTIADLMLPKIFAGMHQTKEDIAEMGEGGLCQTCENCTYPRCYFGH